MSLLQKLLPSNNITASLRWVRRKAQPEWLEGATKYITSNKIFNEPDPPQFDVRKFLFFFETLKIFLQNFEDDLKIKDKSRSIKASIERNKKKILTKRILNLNFDHIPIQDQTVIMFPGQGAQHLRMGTKVCNFKLFVSIIQVIDHPASQNLFKEASEVLGYDLLDICINGPKSKLDQTIYSQPAIFVASMAAMEKLKAEEPNLVDTITETAGFSSGEYCALVLADVIDFLDGLFIFFFSNFFSIKID